jgi:hypothetical protein
MARPTKLTQVRHARIVELLRESVPFATACREVGISASAGYEWLYRGWGTHPDRPPTPAYIAFARDVDAVFPGGFAERYEDEFVDAQSSEETESRAGFAAPVAEPDDIRHEKRTRAREEAGEEPRRAPMPWLSQRRRGERSILDMEF